MQAFYCPGCKAAYTAELRGHSCPACGEELIHGRIPAGQSTTIRRSSTPGPGRAVWDVLLKRDICCYCGNEKSTTIDHIVPKALGGSKGSWTNRTGSCFSCNQEKEHTPLLFFMLERTGENLDWMKNEEGHWPIPASEDELKQRTQHEISISAPEYFNPHAVLMAETQGGREQNGSDWSWQTSENGDHEDAARWADEGGALPPKCRKCRGTGKWRDSRKGRTVVCPKCGGLADGEEV